MVVKRIIYKPIKANNPNFPRITTPSRPINLSSLPSSSNILLFTPVVNPVGSKSSTGQRKQRKGDLESDPFEPLGRALSVHHERIRHVPYRLCGGYTETHAAFLRQADAVVIVVCQSCMDEHRCLTLYEQMKFAEAVQKDLRKMKPRGGRDLVLALVMEEFDFGDANYHLTDISLRAEVRFRHVFHARVGYDHTVAKELAEAMFTCDDSEMEDDWGMKGGSPTKEGLATKEDLLTKEVPATNEVSATNETSAKEDWRFEDISSQWMEKALRLA